MTIIVFLIDTSASMYQRAYLGGRPTLLDVAKGAVETFVKVRQRSPESRGDRYMLLTFDDPPHNIKAGWKENLATFMNELKNLQCFSMTTMGAALKQAFDLLNLNRMQTGIDTYGQGRCPFFLEPSVIVVITDGGKLSSVNGVHEDFNLPMHSPIPGSELTREPFRWDQRLFALVLRLAGTPAVDRDTGLVPSDSSPIDAMCEVTGGRSYCITSHRMLMQCIDSLVQKVQNGVVINFEKIGPDPPLQNEKGEDIEDGETPPEKEESTNVVDVANERLNGLFSSQNTTWHSCRKLIYVPKAPTKGFALGFWPIPESFWPELTATVLPARNAHPNVKFTCTSQEPMVIENLPFDKYELEPSPLTQFILARKQPTTCWQVFVSNSYKSSEVGHPFGYLKASTNLSCVNLFVMPYNYPVLLPLLDELFKVHRLKPTNEWRTQFQNYMRTMPAYYAGPLRRALSRMGTPLGLAQTLIPDNAENSLSYCVLNYLKRMKNQAKVDFDVLCNDVLTRQNNAAKVTNSISLEQIRVPLKAVLKKELVTHPLLQDKFNAQREQILQSEFGGFVIGVDRQRWQSGQSFRNPFDIPRDRLVHQVARMRNNFLQPDYKLADDDSAHSMPVSQMGNYQEYLKRQTPLLREIESTPVRQHMFGNPFKIDKRMMVDEADIDLVGTPGTNRTSKRNNSTVDPTTVKLPNKRKPGPVPRDFVVRKPSVDGTPPASPAPPSPQPSPVPWFDTPLHPVEQDYAPIDSNMEVAHYSMNGSGDESIRSRSPSPPFPREIPYYALPVDSAMLDSALSATPNTYEDYRPLPPSVNVPESIPSEEKHISLILKEVNNINNHNSVHDNAQNDKEIEKHNIEVRKTLNKLVRRPGKNFTELFDEIKLLKGEGKVQVQVLRHIVVESLRFKRQQLAEMLENQIQAILSTENNLDSKSNT